MESLQMLNQGFLETFNDSTTVLTKLTQNQVELTGNTADLSTNLTEQLKTSTEVNEQINGMLHEIAENHQVSSRMQNHFEELFKMITSEYSRIDDSKEQFMNQLKGQLEQMDLRVNDLKSFWTTNHEELAKNRELFTSMNQKLDGSMEKFANNMHQGLGRTFDQFDKQLGKSVEYLERGVNSIRTVIETMEGDIEQVNSTVTQFNQALKQVSATKVMGSGK
jgi:DNA repair exonuclease SbcCD ATPase subunit